MQGAEGMKTELKSSSLHVAEEERMHDKDMLLEMAVMGEQFPTFKH